MPDVLSLFLIVQNARNKRTDKDIFGRIGKSLYACRFRLNRRDMLPIIDIHLLRDIQEVNVAFISVLQRIVRENAHVLLREPLSPETEARLMAMDDQAIERMARSSMLACSFHCTGPEVLNTLGIPAIDAKLIPVALPQAKVVD
ncbi:flagellar transcriptional regulator FlhD [Schauerella aestuarii]|uniref:flagellar transcriptional regulator FlhD n=1 Tax=Schauerella aestuarii TaxID=2511204 RepID=UPI00136DF1EE|nr:flagellar transcriptional regulator FlhD [Achromobacter aestuarii]MYZ41696.1 hypothetical protein [Achromobacter aestuarii]